MGQDMEMPPVMTHDTLEEFLTKAAQTILSDNPKAGSAQASAVASSFLDAHVWCHSVSTSGLDRSISSSPRELFAFACLT
jgi:hypothetical protein